MANRGATAAVRAEWDKARNEPLHLFELHLDNGVIRATDGIRTIEWPAGSGNQYLANGYFLSYEAIEESLELREGRARISLSGVDQVHIANALAQNYLDRRAVIYQAFLSASGGLIVDPVPIFDGVVDRMGFNEDSSPTVLPAPGAGNCTVFVEAASRFSDFGRRPGRHTNHEEQQLHFSGDNFFEFVSEQNRQITWGGGTVVPTQAPRFGDVDGGGWTQPPVSD